MCMVFYTCADLISFTCRNKDNYWTALINFYQTKPSGNDDHIQKQIVYCATLILVRCLNEYLSAVEPSK